MYQIGFNENYFTNSSIIFIFVQHLWIASLKYSDLLCVLKQYDPEGQNGKPRLILHNKMIVLIKIIQIIRQISCNVKEFLPILEIVTIFHIEIYFINLILFPMHFHIYIATKSLSTKTFLQQGNKLIHLDKYGFCVMHISHMSLLFSLLFITVMQREIIVGHILTL